MMFSLLHLRNIGISTRSQGGHAIWPNRDRADHRPLPTGARRYGERGVTLRLAVVLVFATFARPAESASVCQLAKYVEIPVMLDGNRPLVSMTIGGKPARFILDSGAFYSSVSRASAAEFNLKLVPAPARLRINGANGGTSAAVASVRDFGLNDVILPQVDFLVGGTDTGTTGLLGQNFLGIGDVEYDLPHGTIRLLSAKDCSLGALAYWAGSKPFTLIALEPRVPPFRTQTIGTVILNGVKLRAIFDTGAESSLVSIAAARRVGITANSPGVTPAGFGSGSGTRDVQIWNATFDRLDIGGEMISRPRLIIGDVQLGGADLLIGIDFFRTHRIYVANTAAKMLVTYEGGPFFGLRPTRALSSEGTPLDLSDKAAEPVGAEAYSRRGAVLASSGRLDAALADFDKAVALAPRDASYLRLRAKARLANHQPVLAAADIDKAIGIDPSDVEARLARAALRLESHDLKGAHDDLIAADKVLPPSSDKRLLLGSQLNATDDAKAALPNFDAWLRTHPEDAERSSALNGRCWTLALLNRDLDRALDDCNAAIRVSPNDAAFLDSRALVHLRRNELPKALIDYDAAIKIAPVSAWSLYARSVVRMRLGDVTGAAADRAAAIALQPDVVGRGRNLGIEG